MALFDRFLFYQLDHLFMEVADSRCRFSLPSTDIYCILLCSLGESLIVPFQTIYHAQLLSITNTKLRVTFKIGTYPTDLTR